MAKKKEARAGEGEATLVRCGFCGRAPREDCTVRFSDPVKPADGPHSVRCKDGLKWANWHKGLGAGLPEGRADP